LFQLFKDGNQFDKLRKEVCEGTTYEASVGVIEVPDSNIEAVSSVPERLVVVDSALYSHGSIVMFDIETTGLCTFMI